MLQNDPRHVVRVRPLSTDLSGPTSNAADEVFDFVFKTWNTWFDTTSAVNVCMVTLHTGECPRQFVYCSITHKYSDGGSAAAFLHSLSESYEAQLRGNPVPRVESTVLSVQQERLQLYLSGVPPPLGAVDVYFQDINADSFNHGRGTSIAVNFTHKVCDTIRLAGQRIGCSEEIAWLGCITCALCRLLPDEKVIKLMMVHNGRIGEAEGTVACVSQYVMLSIPCASERSNTPLADIVSRVNFAITHGRFTRPAPLEQAHAKINIGGMIGVEGHFVQVFKTMSSKKGSTSRAPHVLQLRMDNEGGIWAVKDCKIHNELTPSDFWRAVICVGKEIADGWFTDPLGFA